ncbi:MAG TPA: tRNA (adenosine(37)-N6)-dimethylallyltransferase MiaA, partial [Treponemataceae bacterium]|nr:tRNA (adenosine(37)-N6)-dimethylallyltransferase MiaA [Treponemataceae bacterium]
MNIESKNNNFPHQSTKIPVLVLCAATATGKTDFLLSSFNKNNHEIISADSLQIYKELSIGTAKPNEKERAILPHHLIDFIDPQTEFGSGDFVRLADSFVLDIWNRRKLPIIAGGTGFFIKNFLYGLPPTPKADENLRKSLQERLEKEGGNQLYDELFSIDKERAEKLHPHDSYRVLRALEVYYSSGKTLSSFEQKPQLRSEYEFLVLFLTRNRESLYERINLRVEKMFAEGLWEELIFLTESRKPALQASDPSMSAIGYKEFFLYAKENGKKISEFTKDDCLCVEKLIQRNTRHYAKRQIVFFKGLPSAISLHIDDNLAIKTIIN